ncbi:hypothetical protein B7P43_G06196 [Cryptotermes secundus]|uniref:Mos1 transposase HTH domain-containing protein n=1 Tax=Cryptotermes secundus TaxID=105785 RepID=A0A2J7RAP4_9NEOP|nr:hypothetical protein B7P43_G06196 [Cryptotermes secundus]
MSELLKLGKSGSEITERLMQVYGDNAMKETAAYNYVTRFSQGRESVTDEESSERTATRRTEENITKVRQILCENLRLSVRSIAEQANIDRETHERTLSVREFLVTKEPILSQVNPVHTIPYYFSTIQFNIIQLHTSKSSSRLFPSGFPTKILYAILFSPIRAMCPTYLMLLTSASGYIWPRVQIMKLLIMQCSPAFNYFIPLGSKYSPHHLAPKPPQPVYFP